MVTRRRLSEAHIEVECRIKLFQAKWPVGFACPRCGCGKYYLTTRRQPLFECASCRHMTSLTVGTVMEGSRTPLRKWFEAIRLLARTDKGTSAMELMRTIQVTYKTAWLMLHKLRYAMGQREDRQLLTGLVRVNAARYGSPYNPSVYRHPKEHPLMSGASLNQNLDITQLKIKPVPPEHCDDRVADRRWHRIFVEQHVDEANSTVFGQVPRYGENRFQPLLHACKLMSRWLNGTFHGIGAKHLRAYADEFCCRYNLQLSATDIGGHLIDIAAQHSRITYKSLIRRPKNGFNPIPFVRPVRQELFPRFSYEDSRSSYIS